MNGTKIKICGLFRLCDAECVNQALPDYAGFVFYTGSRRYVTPELARELREKLDPRIQTVGVFVDAPLEQIAARYREGTISIVQLHGKEKEGTIAELRRLLPTAEIWKAFRIRSAEDVRAAVASRADLALLDNGGGTGAGFDWTLAEGFPRRFALAGGLTPERIPDAVGRLHPEVLDLSSGVESGGWKDGRKIFAAVAAARDGRVRSTPAEPCTLE